MKWLFLIVVLLLFTACQETGSACVTDGICTYQESARGDCTDCRQAEQQKEAPQVETKTLDQPAPETTNTTVREIRPFCGNGIIEGEETCDPGHAHEYQYFTISEGSTKSFSMYGTNYDVSMTPSGTDKARLDLGYIESPSLGVGDQFTFNNITFTIFVIDDPDLYGEMILWVYATREDYYKNQSYWQSLKEGTATCTPLCHFYEDRYVPGEPIVEEEETEVIANVSNQNTTQNSEEDPAEQEETEDQEPVEITPPSDTSFVIGISDTAPVTDVLLAIDINNELQAQGFLGSNVGGTLLFSQIEQESLHNRVSLVVLNGEAVIIVGKDVGSDGDRFVDQLSAVLDALNVAYSTMQSNYSGSLEDLF